MVNGVYTERPSRLRDAVLWSQTAGASGGLILPDGCMDLIWLDDELIVAGPDTRATTATGYVKAGYAGLRFAPGTGPSVFGLPAIELRDQRVPLGDLWPGPVFRRVSQQLAEAEDKGAALEQVAAERLRDAPPPDPICRAVAADLSRGRSVAAAAHDIGLSDRQLHRRSLAAFGYGPKMLARVLRLQQALDLARRGVAPATVAAMTGYADQSHLAREVRALAGVTLGVLLAG